MRPTAGTLSIILFCLILNSYSQYKNWWLIVDNFKLDNYYFYNVFPCCDAFTYQIDREKVCHEAFLRYIAQSRWSRLLEIFVELNLKYCHLYSRKHSFLSYKKKISAILDGIFIKKVIEMAPCRNCDFVMTSIFVIVNLPEKNICIVIFNV